MSASPSSDQSILPPLDHDDVPPPLAKRPEAIILSTDLPPDLEFTPVVRGKAYRGAKLTPDKQRMFINALAAAGSVTVAGKAVALSTGQLYHLRNSAGAESFAAAWDKAVARGAKRVLDVMVDHAINGVPEYIYKDGELVAERRHFNTRAQMWIVAHNFPESFGAPGGLIDSGALSGAMQRLKEKWRAEWQAERDAEDADDNAAAAEDGDGFDDALRERLIKLYRARVFEEQNYRRRGQLLLADLAMRSLVQVEALLETAGVAWDVCVAAFRGASGEGTPLLTPFTRELASIRAEVWAQDEDVAPRLTPYDHDAAGSLCHSIHGGPRFSERDKARTAAERRIAEAQREWEAARTEEGWAAWRGGGASGGER